MASPRLALLPEWLTKQFARQFGFPLRKICGGSQSKKLCNWVMPDGDEGASNCWQSNAAAVGAPLIRGGVSTEFREPSSLACPPECRQETMSLRCRSYTSVPFRLLAVSAVSIFQVRGVRTLAADVKPGHVVELKGKLQEVTKTVWTMQGRGGASIQVELRDIGSGSKNVDKWRPDQGLERVQMDDREFTFLYDDGAAAVLMNPTTFEQVNVDKGLFGDAAIFLKDGISVSVAFHGDTAVRATLPPQVTCRVVEADATFKGERKSASTKMILLDNGARIQVPSFVEQGDDIMVKTSDQTFVRRAKDTS